MRIPAGLFAIALLTAACASNETPTRISAADLQRLLPGASLTGRTATGEPFEGTYFRDGRVAVIVGNDADTGVWEFDGDLVCLTWKKWRDGKRYCIYWAHDAEGWASYFPDGTLSTRFTFKK